LIAQPQVATYYIVYIQVECVEPKISHFVAPVQCKKSTFVIQLVISAEYMTFSTGTNEYSARCQLKELA